MGFVEAGLLSRAVAAASSLGRELGLPVDDVVVVQNSNALALRLLPCEVFARIALVGQQGAAFEVSVAQSLSAVGAPSASLEPRVDPRVYKRDGFAVSFWTYYDSVPAAAVAASPVGYADALHRLHTALRSVEIDAPHFTERVAAAGRLLTDRDATAALDDAGRALLLDTLRGAQRAICGRVHVEQLLHGEPHSGNLLETRDGLVFIDFESCCRGPVEFDVAHVPPEVSVRYPGVDQVLLQECRRLVLAMVAAWRWDVRDQLPNGRHQGLEILNVLRNGPPWPTLNVLSTS